MVNLIIPCVGIFYLSILSFYLPAQVSERDQVFATSQRLTSLFCEQSGEKTALVTAILVSQTLYYSLVIESIPANSVTLPLLGRLENSNAATYAK